MRPSLYKGYRFPPEIISHCVWLYYRFGVSLRDVSEMMLARGIEVSHETIRLCAVHSGRVRSIEPVVSCSPAELRGPACISSRPVDNNLPFSHYYRSNRNIIHRPTALAVNSTPCTLREYGLSGLLLRPLVRGTSLMRRLAAFARNLALPAALHRGESATLLGHGHPPPAPVFRLLVLNPSSRPSHVLRTDRLRSSTPVIRTGRLQPDDR